MYRLWACIAVFAFMPPAVTWGQVRTEPVTYMDGGQTLKGYLAWDDAIKGKRPGVLVAHEWWGLNDYVRGRTEELARLGYVAFALDMYGEGKATDHGATAKEWMERISTNVEAWRRRAELGLGVLRKNDHVDASRLAAVGFCFGGATVMQLAYGGADIKAIVSFHGSLPAATPEQAKRVKGTVLAAHGSEDAFVPPNNVTAFQQALDKADVDWSMLVLGNARHGFTNPGADKYGNENIRYNAAAEKRAWAAMRRLFEEKLDSGKR